MKRKLLIILAALLLAAAALTVRFIKYYGKACKDYATNGIKGELSAKIIAAVEESVTGSTIIEREAQKTTYDKDGNAETITVDAAYLNGAAVRTAKAVYEAVKKAESDFGIPLGNALGSKLFAGKGPKIGVTITPLGAVTYSIESKLLSAGINQTLHRIVIRYGVNVKCVSPFDEEIIDIEGELIASETIIIGKIPQVYFSGSELSGTFE